ncbi:zinc ABC transporter substrate-binding protein [Oceaniglobus roseus]|uniref:zinc ABC transporter substrate-binding protein n=1 Tax=Oceaniglobus roseus TaxID=1737570 RepID=UPI001FE88E2A|nr:zinc ABC transporter substrate-binding protein [Kandeliimicrobium roseum]
MTFRLSIAAALILSPAAALAEPPRVVTDIPPVQSLAAMVMQDIGTPALLMGKGVSPHDYHMRPSEAGALAESDVVIWIGPELTPSLADSIASLAGDALNLELIDSPGTTVLPTRVEAQLGDAEEHEDHGEAHSVEGDHGDDDGHGHAHGATDPHAWLDPENAKAWLSTIAETLAEIDPDNAAAYFANAETAQARLSEQEEDIADDIADAAPGPHIVFHDAFQYFEARFDIPAAGAIALSDATAPGPARIAALRALVQENKIVCAFAEPQFNAGLVATVFEGSGAKVAVIDPLGTALEPGPGLYPALLDEVAKAMASCG